jgi:chromosome segregation ATPase
MKQTAFFTITILAGLSVVFLVPQWRLAAQEPPRFGENGNGPREARGPDRPSRDRKRIDDHETRSSEGGPMLDRLVSRFDEVISRLDRIEHRVGGDRNPDSRRPPHGREHVGNEQRRRGEERRHHFGRSDHDHHTREDDQVRHPSEMAEQAHLIHEEMRNRLEDHMQHAREMMEQARERFMELNERIEELEEEMREVEERLEALHPPAVEMVEE